MFKKILIASFPIAILALAPACSGADAPGPATQAPAALSSESDSGPGNDGPGFHDPAQFIKRFDKDGNGVLSVSELPPRLQKWLADADTNQDGNLSVDELKAHAQKQLEAHFKSMDKNGDGALTADEVGERRWAHLKAADADNSGSVTLAELSAAFASGKLHPMGGHGGHDGHGEHGEHGGRGEMHDPAKLIAHFDQNKNGILELSELPPRMQNWLGAADTNHDGALSVDEIKAFQDAHHPNK